MAAIEPPQKIDKEGVPYYDFRWAVESQKWIVLRVQVSEHELKESDKIPLYIGVVKLQGFGAIPNGFVLTIKDFSAAETEKLVAVEREKDREFQQYNIQVLPEKYRRTGDRVIVSTLADPYFKKPFLAGTDRLNGSPNYNQMLSR